MKKEFTHENFEHFLKDNADDLQMRPSADVWNRIEGRMNRRRRWVFFTSAFFLLTASLLGYVIIDHSKTPSDPFAAVTTIQEKESKSSENKSTNPAAPNSVLQSARESRPPLAVAASENKEVAIADSKRSGKLFQKPMPVENEETTAGTALSSFTPTIVDEHEPLTQSGAESNAEQKAVTENTVPTIESVVNSYKPKYKRRKSEFQLYFTPTISYRRLTENKSYLRSVPQNMATFTLAALYDVNSMVTHKPDLGLELGFAYKLPVTGRVKLRTGMQFNITRYDIKAFTYVPERTTIALNNRARGIDSVATMSSYRNFSGGREDWIQNFYFQVSTPVGVDVVLNNSKKTKFGIAGTIQPTYVLGDRAYLISSDYKNYSQVPWLIRRWNVNTSLETFVSYSTGKLRWQVGPQVRYQLLSSFVEKYPVKENLFDFGMKVGVSLDKK